MKAGRTIVGMVAVALCAAGALVVPTAGAVTAAPRDARRAAPARSFAGGFTPAAADPRLAALFARSGLPSGDFRFTPADTRRDGRRVVVAVQVRSSRATAATSRLAAATPAPMLAPIAYNVGAAMGWKRFAVTGDLARIDMGPLPGSREAADLSVSYSARRFTGRLKAATDRPFGEVAELVDLPQSYSVDIGGAYKLTRNLDVTAGLRYRTDRDRLSRLDDGRHDSQAAYVGTVFRF